MLIKEDSSYEMEFDFENNSIFESPVVSIKKSRVGRPIRISPPIENPEIRFCLRFSDDTPRFLRDIFLIGKSAIITRTM